MSVAPLSTMVAPDLAGLSLGGAYQAALQAGFGHFQITAFRETAMADPTYLWVEVAPATGYVTQTTSPGSAGMITATTPPEGSFYTSDPEPGVPDQSPAPGSSITGTSILSFVYKVPDTGTVPSDFTTSGRGPTGLVAWWTYSFSAGSVPASLQVDLSNYNGAPLTPVDVSGQAFLAVAQDPLLAFTAPPTAEPVDMLADVPEFERRSYEIETVLRVVGNEINRLESARLAVAQNFFPGTADVLLPRFEELLGLPVNPPTIDLNGRRRIVVAYLNRLKGEGRGLDWIASISALCGTNWRYEEHNPADPNSPAAYSVNVNIPEILAQVGWNLVRDVTPAHLVINPGYVEGWLVGIALLDDTDL